MSAQHPTLTPYRAVWLLKALNEGYDTIPCGAMRHAVDETRRALRHHVCAGLSRARRRRRRAR